MSQTSMTTRTHCLEFARRVGKGSCFE